MGHPPCEDVSWKIYIVHFKAVCVVILLVRMWVEKIMLRLNSASKSSSSLWGCELKNCRWAFWFARKSHPPCEDVSWKNKEHPAAVYCDSHPPCEDVSWKVDDVDEELKAVGHPPCEDVSWKEDNSELEVLMMSSSLWGCELKNLHCTLQSSVRRHPPCEDVSWKDNKINLYAWDDVILLVRMWVEKRMM